MSKRYILSDVYGMCGGVFAALKILQNMVDRHPGEAVFVLHELVHNRTVTGDFENKGVRFVNSIGEIPPGAPVVIGAHGTAPEMEQAIRAIAGEVADATCPLVKKLQLCAKNLTQSDQLVLFGKKGHAEVIAVLGNSGAGQNFTISSPADIDALPELDAPFFISQTTVDFTCCCEVESRLRQRFPALRCNPGVCDASRKRQEAVIKLASLCPVVIVAGSEHSSNAKRLQEIAQAHGARAFLVENAENIPETLLQESTLIGITAGASTPEDIVKKIIAKLQQAGFSS